MIIEYKLKKQVIGYITNKGNIYSPFLSQKFMKDYEIFTGTYTFSNIMSNVSYKYFEDIAKNLDLKYMQRIVLKQIPPRNKRYVHLQNYLDNDETINIDYDDNNITDISNQEYAPTLFTDNFFNHKNVIIQKGEIESIKNDSIFAERKIDNIFSIRDTITGSFVTKLNSNRILFFDSYKNKLYRVTCENNEDRNIIFSMISEGTSKSIFTLVWDMIFKYKNAPQLSKEKDDNSSLYKHYQIPKSNGSMRDIYEPRGKFGRDLKMISTELNFIYMKRYHRKHLEDTMFGYTKKVGIKNMSNKIKNDKFVIKLDLHAMFDNINFKSYEDTLKHMIIRNSLDKKDLSYWNSEFYYGNKELAYKFYYGNKVLEYIKKAIINKKTGGLFMGNPMSPVLANIVMVPLALHIKNSMKSKDINFSIYADDMIFSCNDRNNKFFNINFIKWTVEEIISYSGLEINNKKTMKMRNNTRRILGIRINHKNQLTSDRYIYEKYKTAFLHIKLNPEEFSYTKMNLPGLYNQSSFLGKLNYYRYIDETGKWEKLIDKYITEYLLVKTNQVGS